MFIIPLAATTAAGQSAILASVLLIALGLVEVVKYLITRNKDSKVSVPKHLLTPGERQALFRIDQYTAHMKEQHDRCDEDGTPLWYMPRSINKQNAQIIDIQRKIVVILDRMADRMDDKDERMLKLLEKLNDKMPDHKA